MSDVPRAPIVVFQVTVSADPDVMANIQEAQRLRATQPAPARSLPSDFAQDVATKILLGLAEYFPAIVSGLADEMTKRQQQE